MIGIGGTGITWREGRRCGFCGGFIADQIRVANLDACRQVPRGWR